jgi:hypothetical protein
MSWLAACINASNRLRRGMLYKDYLRAIKK